MGGKATIGAKKKRNQAKALQILCDVSVKLSGYDALPTIAAWNGYTENELRQMTKEHRRTLNPEDLHSGVAINRIVLKGSLPHAIATLEQMRIQNLDATPHEGASYPS